METEGLGVKEREIGRSHAVHEINDISARSGSGIGVTGSPTLRVTARSGEAKALRTVVIGEDRCVQVVGNDAHTRIGSRNGDIVIKLRSGRTIWVPER